MPRNGSGNYSLPEPPFVPLTTISSAAMNSDLSDMASALTASLARDGQGGMTDVLPLNTAGFSYTSDTNTGMYRTGSDAQAIKCGGTNVVAVTTSGASVAGTLSATTIQQNGITLLPVGLGPLPWSGGGAPTGWVLANGQSLSRTTYAALWTFAQAEIAQGNILYGNGDGSTTFTVPDLRGRLPFGRNNMGGPDAGRLSGTYYGGNPNIIGSPGGTESKTLAQANLPNVAPTFSGTPANLQFTAGAGVLISSGFTASIGGGASALLGVVGTPSLPTYTPSGTVSSLNGGVTQTAFSAIAPGIITTYIIFAGV